MNTATYFQQGLSLYFIRAPLMKRGHCLPLFEKANSQLTFTSSKSTIGTLEKDVKYVQS